MINALLVDDEELSLKNLELLLREAGPDIQVVGTAGNALDAISSIFQLKPDVVFLDVNMPGYSGFDVLERVKEQRPLIVFTTAHKNYAINALRKGAFDYLLKPVDIDELKLTLERIRSEQQRKAPGKTNGVIGLSVKDGIIFVRQSEIVRLEASGSYTVFHLENNTRHLVSKSMKEYEAQLDARLFFRCHNSHIINLSMVSKFVHSNGYFAEMRNGAVIEIARKNKDQLLERLKVLKG